MTYSQKLKSPHWQKKRLEILQRDGFTCKECGSKDKPLHVHHVVYRRIDPWEYPNYLYQTFCEDCHKIRQELNDKIVDALRIAIKETPTQRLQIASQELCSAAMVEIDLEGK